MNQTIALFVLLLAATLEAAGDALVRGGLRAPLLSTRLLLFLAGAGVLFGYGYVVNTPAWDFGRLLGVYVVFFFIVAQFISYFVFHTAPTKSIVAGGLFIVLGGLIISFGG